MTFGFSGGADKNVVVFDKNEEQIVATFKGHTKKVTSVIYHPSQVCFHDKNVLMSRHNPAESIVLTLVFTVLVGGLLCVSRQYHTCVVCHWGQLCPGGTCPRGGCHWALSSCYWGLPA